MQITGIPLKYLLGVPIESGSITPKGLLNTETILTFVIEGRGRNMPIALLVTNLPPYIALIMATSGITWKRRLLILFYGCAILCFFHAIIFRPHRQIVSKVFPPFVPANHVIISSNTDGVR